MAGHAQPAAADTASPAGAAAITRDAWLPGYTSSGTRGLNRVITAFPLAAGEIALTVGGEIFRTHDFLVTGDTNERQTQHIGLLWAPLDGLELGLAHMWSTNTNRSFANERVQISGDPRFSAKYALPVQRGLGVGGGVSVMLPTLPKGAGLKARALVVGAYGAVSYMPTGWLQVSANLGYCHDRTDELFETEINVAQRFASGVTTTDTITTGLGVGAHFDVAGLLALGPFAEITTAYGPGAAFSDGPTRGTVGLKVFPFASGRLELAVGADLRITGAPVPIDPGEVAGTQAGAPGTESPVFPGVPPWEAFVRLSFHVGGDAAPTSSSDPVPAPPRGPPPCSADSDCASGRTCDAGTCVMVKEVVREVVKPAPTFTISGVVTDEDSGEPVQNARIKISGSDDTLLGVDHDSGEFHSWAIPIGEGIVQLTVSARGYDPYEQAIPKGAADENTRVEVKLKPDAKPKVGELKGSLKDGRTGQVIAAGKVFIPVLGEKLATDQNGDFAATVKAGLFQVLISAPGYATQKKEITIRSGDVVILNVDMRAKKRRR